MRPGAGCRQSPGLPTPRTPDGTRRGGGGLGPAPAPHRPPYRRTPSRARLRAHPPPPGQPLGTTSPTALGPPSVLSPGTSPPPPQTHAPSPSNRAAASDDLPPADQSLRPSPGGPRGAFHAVVAPAEGEGEAGGGGAATVAGSSADPVRGLRSAARTEAVAGPGPSEAAATATGAEDFGVAVPATAGVHAATTSPALGAAGPGGAVGLAPEGYGPHRLDFDGWPLHHSLGTGRPPSHAPTPHPDAAGAGPHAPHPRPRGEYLPPSLAQTLSPAFPPTPETGPSPALSPSPDPSLSPLPAFDTERMLRPILSHSERSTVRSSSSGSGPRAAAVPRANAYPTLQALQQQLELLRAEHAQIRGHRLRAEREHQEVRGQGQVHQDSDHGHGQLF